MNIQSNLEMIVNIVKNIVPLREAFLFGSYAYGEPHKDSDFDLYFIADKIDGSRHEAVVEIRKALHGVIQKPIDVLLSTKDNFDYRKGNNGTLEYKVAKDGIKLYG